MISSLCLGVSSVRFQITFSIPCLSSTQAFISLSLLRKHQKVLCACRFRVDYALSREQKNKKGGKMYIQDKVEEYADEVFDLLDNGAHIYFCGLKGMMPGTTMNTPCAVFFFPFFQVCSSSSLFWCAGTQVLVIISSGDYQPLCMLHPAWLLCRIAWMQQRSNTCCQCTCICHGMLLSQLSVVT